MNVDRWMSLVFKIIDYISGGLHVWVPTSPLHFPITFFQIVSSTGTVMMESVSTVLIPYKDKCFVRSTGIVPVNLIPLFIKNRISVFST